MSLLSIVKINLFHQQQLWPEKTVIRSAEMLQNAIEFVDILRRLKLKHAIQLKKQTMEAGWERQGEPGRRWLFLAAFNLAC